MWHAEPLLWIGIALMPIQIIGSGSYLILMQTWIKIRSQKNSDFPKCVKLGGGGGGAAPQVYTFRQCCGSGSGILDLVPF